MPNDEIVSLVYDGQGEIVGVRFHPALQARNWRQPRRISWR